VLKTPALLALVPAVALNAADVAVPLVLTRIIGVLADAMIPIMILSLGVKLSEAPRLRVDGNLVLAGSVRLIVGPLVAIALAVPFALEGTVRDAGILQASMPTAVLASIIAIEYDLLPEFVTEAVLFSTVASFATLTVLMAVM
jgi:hypothetical protein